MKIVEGITAKMEKQLRCRKKAYRGQSDAERWKDIYKLLFPLEAVPDPCEFLNLSPLDRTPLLLILILNLN